MLQFAWIFTCPSANTYSLSNFSKILGKTFYSKIFQQNIAKLYISFCETNIFRQVQWLHINVIPPVFFSGRKFQLIHNEKWNLQCSHSLHIDALSKAPSNAIIRMHGMLEVLENIFLQNQFYWYGNDIVSWYFHISTDCDLYQNYQFPFWNFWWSGGSQFEISNRALARIFLVLKYYFHHQQNNRNIFWCLNIISTKNIFGFEILSPTPMK